MSDFLDFKDEIIDGEPKYNIVDKNGNTINKNVFIDLANDVIESGTELNKNTSCKFNAIKGYNETKVEKHLYRTEEDVSLGTNIKRSLPVSVYNIIKLSNSKFMGIYLPDDGDGEVYILNENLEVESTKTFARPSYSSVGISPDFIEINELIYVPFTVKNSSSTPRIFYKVFYLDGTLKETSSILKTEDSDFIKGDARAIKVDDTKFALTWVVVDPSVGLYKNILMIIDVNTNSIIQEKVVSSGAYPKIIDIAKLDDNTLFLLFDEYDGTNNYKIYKISTNTIGSKVKLSLEGYGGCLVYDGKLIVMSSSGSSAYFYIYEYKNNTLELLEQSSSISTTSRGGFVVSTVSEKKLLFCMGKNIDIYDISDNNFSLKQSLTNNIGSGLTLEREFLLSDNPLDKQVRIMGKSTYIVWEIGEHNYYENKFVADYIQDNFKENELLLIESPSEVILTDVEKNSINGIDIDTKLEANRYYELVYKNVDNKFYAKVVRV